MTRASTQLFFTYGLIAAACAAYKCVSTQPFGQSTHIIFNEMRARARTLNYVKYLIVCLSFYLSVCVCLHLRDYSSFDQMPYSIVLYR